MKLPFQWFAQKFQRMFNQNGREASFGLNSNSSRLLRAAQYFGLQNAAECVAAFALFVLIIVLRVTTILTWRFDSDESQHLHVVWGWARGFVQYRDLCDNHMPLFHLLFAPIYALIGDRPTILYWMRFLILPIYFGTMAATYRTGVLLFSRRVGIWSLILVGLYPGYQFVAAEFRPDNLWAPIWVVALIVLLQRPLTIPRAMSAGLLLGCCFGISMKTSLLCLALIAGAALTFFLSGRRHSLGSPIHLASCCAAFVFSATVVPGLIMMSFAVNGVWPQFRYWVFENNIFRGVTDHPKWWTYLFPTLFPLIVCFATFLKRRVRDQVAGLRICLVLLTCGFYLTALWSYWSLITRQDYLPFHPLAFVLYTGALLSGADWITAKGWGAKWVFRRLPIPALVAGVELLVCVFSRPFWMNPARTETDLLRATLKLTDPGDFVFDEKGETVFRQRCFAPVWEPFVAERVRRGFIADDAPQRCVETRTCVATKGKDMSVAASGFIGEHYLSVGNGLYVAGAFLKSFPGSKNQFSFEVVIPSTYKIISSGEPVRGTLDQLPYTGPIFLNPGRHIFTAAGGVPLAVVWAQAVQRGFSPFSGG